MEKIKLELYTDYLICNNGFATATGLSAMIEGDISHDQMTRFQASWYKPPLPALAPIPSDVRLSAAFQAHKTWHEKKWSN